MGKNRATRRRSFSRREHDVDESIRWVFRLVDARPGDTLDDLYPGSGIVGRSWRLYAGGTP